MYVVIRSTLLKQDGDLPRRGSGGKLCAFSVLFFYGSTHVVLCSPTESCLSMGFFVVIRMIQVMINLDHVKMEVIVVCVCMWRLVVVRGEVKDESALGPLGRKVQGTAA